MNASSPSQQGINQSNPYSKLIRLDMLEKLPLPQDKKAQHVQIVSKHWATIRTKPRDSPEHETAINELTKYTTQLQQHLARNRQLQAGATGASSSPAPRPATAPHIQTQPAPVQAQTGAPIQTQPAQSLSQQPPVNPVRNPAIAAAASASTNMPQPQPQQPQPQQQQQNQQKPQLSDAIRTHINTFTFTHPPDAPKGTAQGEAWLTKAKSSYANLLVQQEAVTKSLNAFDLQGKTAQNQGSQIPPDLIAKRAQFSERHKVLNTSIANFRQSQAKMHEQELANNKDATKPPTPAAINTAPNTTRTQGIGAAAQSQVPSTIPSNPALDAARNAAAARSSSSPTSATAPHSAMGQPPTSFASSKNRPGAPPARPGLTAHQPSSAGVAPTSQSVVQPVPLTHVAAIDRSHSERSQAPGSQPAQTTPTHFAPRTQSETQVHKNFPMSKTLPPSTMQPPTPVSAGVPRPTMANGGSLSQPIIAKQPTFTLEGDAKSHVLSKKKLDELVRQVTGSTQNLTPHAEETIMEMADEFVDNVVTAACRLAKLRSDSTLQIRDIQTVLERSYNIRIPGYSIDETRVVRRVNPAPGWSQKMNAINAAKVMNNTKTDP